MDRHWGCSKGRKGQTDFFLFLWSHFTSPSLDLFIREKR